MVETVQQEISNVTKAAKPFMVFIKTSVYKCISTFLLLILVSVFMIVGFGQSIMTVSDNYAVTLKNFMLPMRCMTTNDGAGRELASYATIEEKVQQQGVHSPVIQGAT